MLGVHDDIIKWKHFLRFWPFVWGIHRSLVNSPHKGQWRRALMYSLFCARINSWVNNREAGDLRRHHADYDVTIMCLPPLGKIGKPLLEPILNDEFDPQKQTSVKFESQYKTSYWKKICEMAAILLGHQCVQQGTRFYHTQEVVSLRTNQLVPWFSSVI